MKWVLEHVGNNFVAHIIAPMNVCLDKTLALFKGFNPYGVIMQCKPGKYGSKLFNLAAIIGTPVCLGFMLSQSKAAPQDLISIVMEMLGKYLPSDQSHHVFTDKWFNTHATTEAILEIGHDVTGAMDRHKYAQVFDRRLEHARDDTMGHTATHRRYITKDGTPHVISANGVVFPHITPQKKQLQGFLSTAMHGSMMEEGNVKSLDVLQAYNENKRSVDTFNQMVCEIEFLHKSRRFAFPLLTFCCNAAIVNSLAAYIHTEHACVSVRQVAEAIARELVPEQKGCILSSVDHSLCVLTLCVAYPNQLAHTAGKRHKKAVRPCTCAWFVILTFTCTKSALICIIPCTHNTCKIY